MREWKIEAIIGHIGMPAVYEQLAEECIELAHVCMKKARMLRGENPTPRSGTDITKDITEEMSDVSLLMSMVPECKSYGIMDEKCDRWMKRLGIR